MRRAVSDDATPGEGADAREPVASEARRVARDHPQLGNSITVGAIDIYLPKGVRVEVGDPPAVVHELADGTSSSIPLADYAEMRRDSVHNDDAPELVLGRYVEGDDSSYIAVAERAGSTYFDMGANGWARGTDGYGVPPDGMFDLFNRPVLDAAIMEGKSIRFTHDPDARPDSFLFQEARYLEDFGYVIIEDGNGGWVARP